MAHVNPTDNKRRTNSPDELCHIVFYTTKFEAMVDWYCKVLDAYPIMNNGTIAFLTYDEEHHRVAIVKKSNLQVRPQDCVGFAHAAFGFSELGGLVTAYSRLKSQEIFPVWEINHGMTTSIYYADPDGNRIELQVDNFRTLDDLNAWFATGAFERNPIGVEISFDEIVQRYNQKEPTNEILQPLSV